MARGRRACANGRAVNGRDVTPFGVREDQAALAQRYGDIFAVFMKNRASIARVTIWGLRDTDSWRRPQSPLLFDNTYTRNPAYDAVIAAAKKTGS